ncbi:sugar kinase [Litchfieldia salsa]|uniref:2-dehydro-3-deoxygluconokinase n=1 Tax=Litchfieldia salsa TaxID=930152 RepID=A0A1H0WSI2_9BACI|nr:sugar kinase [Litchfieldia salsa]SDP93455.1 2-dehydro-3-deoxygluconokinase [Litchfieldia salsa]
MKKIVTLGEIMLRLSTNVGERLSQVDQLTMHYGGAEANVGVSLSQFGFDVYFVSKVPDNVLGKAVERHLLSNGVHTEYLVKGGERLGTYYLETGIGERSATVTYDRKHSSFSTLTVEELDLEAILHGAEVFHMSGITLALSSGLRDLALLAMKKAKELGVKTSFDFNYRASLWSQQEASGAIKPLLPYTDICFCGELDAVYLLDIQQADNHLSKSEKLKYYYNEIQKQYPNIQVMSSTFRTVLSASNNKLQGNHYVEGKLYQSKEHHISQIVDRVGGGDAFASGVLYGIVEKLPPEQVISFATAASALKHTVHGDANAFSPEEVFKFAGNNPGEILR